jgi:hypothetical protein
MGSWGKPSITNDGPTEEDTEERVEGGGDLVLREGKPLCS